MKRFVNFRLDISNGCVWRDNTQLSLSPKPFAVLQYLVEHPGRLVTHDELLDALWPDTYVQPQVLRTYVLDLRKLLGDDAGDPRFIQTVPKRGYYFVAHVEECGDAGHAPIERASRTAEAVEPGMAKAPAPVEIVGRESELERMGTLLEAASNGQRQIVFITGDSGIGKTALADAFQAAKGIAHAALIMRGQCVEGLGRKEEYYPVMEALSQLCASADGERACRILARMAPAWLAVLGRDAESTSRATRRMTGELCEALEEFSQERPLVLVFEDLHWSDDATVHLISALARRRASARLMVVATYRPYDVSHDRVSLDTFSHGEAEQNLEHPLKGLKHDLTMRRLCAEIVLEPLAKTAVKLLLARELKQEALPSGLSGLVHQFSGGNPLFVLAILEHLIAQGYLVRQMVDGIEQWGQCGTTAEMAANVPAGLAQMIELELDRLGAEDRRLLEAGSLIDVAFPAWAVAAALEKDVAEAEEALDQLARRLSFVQRVGQDELPDGSRSAFYVFAHGIYREVLYQRQSAARLARRHIRVAVRLGELFAGRKANVAREMALHFEAGCDWQRAVDSLRIAADHAAQRQAYAEAEQLLDHALRLAGNLPDDDAWQQKRAIENALGDLMAGSRAESFAGTTVKKASRKS